MTAKKDIIASTSHMFRHIQCFIYIFYYFLHCRWTLRLSKLRNNTYWTVWQTKKKCKQSKICSMLDFRFFKVASFAHSWYSLDQLMSIRVIVKVLIILHNVSNMLHPWWKQSLCGWPKPRLTECMNSGWILEPTSSSHTSLLQPSSGPCHIFPNKFHKVPASNSFPSKLIHSLFRGSAYCHSSCIQIQQHGPPPRSVSNKRSNKQKYILSIEILWGCLVWNFIKQSNWPTMCLLGCILINTETMFI